MSSISTKIVNRDIVSISLNNIRNPQIKKLMRHLDNFYASIIFFISKDVKSYYINNDNFN